VGDREVEGAPVGELLRRYRLQARLTQEELGERAELSVRAVRNLEQGRVGRPRPDTVRRLASALVLDPEQEARLVAATRGAKPGGTANGVTVESLVRLLNRYCGSRKTVLVVVCHRDCAEPTL
jgi:transcriptional regulator with XRE-family HTH domain